MLTRIDNREIAVITDMVSISTEDADTHTMEGGDEGILRARIEVNRPLAHFPRSFIGKGNRKDIPRINHFFFNEVGDSVGQDAGLARTRSRHDQKWPFCCLYCLRLTLVHTL